MLPDFVADANIELEFNNSFYSKNIAAVWLENIPNKEYYSEMALYNEALDKYEIALKEFEEYQKRKAQGEQESLENEVLRLRRRLAIKEQELANKISESL